MGLTVLALDKNPSAPGLSVATYGYSVDPSDAGSVLTIARKAQIRAIVPVPLGNLLKVVGVVNEALGLKGIRERAATLSVDKLRMREVLSSAGIPQPRWYSAVTQSEVLQVAQEVGFPFVLKPRFGSSSRGVLLVRSMDELQIGLDWHFSATKNSSCFGEILIESVMSGQEYGIDGVVVDGSFRLLAIRLKEMTSFPYRVALGYRTPVTLSKQGEFQLNSNLYKACKAMELKDCLVHADFMIDNNETVKIIELSGRPSGFSLSQKLIPEVTGIQPTQEALKMMLDLNFSFQTTKTKVGLWRTFNSNFKVAKKFHELSQDEHIVELFIGEEDAGIFRQNRTGEDAYRRGYAIIVGETWEEIHDIWLSLEQELACNFEI
jgi:biotin carboxylase